MGQKQRAEFRQEVVRVALTSGLSRKQVASDFGIGFSTLSRWLKEGRSNITPSEPRIDLIQENERLRKENRLLREEREILKKATQFFKTIKIELIWRPTWYTGRQPELTIFEYIIGFYNPRRKHSTLGWESPLAFERMAA